MAKSRSRIADYGVYLIARVVVCFLQALPPRAAYGFASGLAWLAYRLDRRHRLAAFDNLRFSFPHLGDAAADRMVRAVYRHFCALLIDIIHTPRRLHSHNWRQHVDLVHGPAIAHALLSGRPVLLVTGHFGNWEMGGYVLGLLGFTTHAIARRLDNRHVDDFLRLFRERTGQRILDKNGDFDRIQAVLARNGVLATLGDQDAGPRGLFVDFFGRPASTHKAVALLALEYQVPMLVIGVRKLPGDIRYQVVVEDTILPEEYASQPDAARAVTQRFTDALERIVRRDPEQYFWLHRRWKHEPPKRKAKRVA